MNRTGIDEDRKQREASLVDPIAEMTTWAGRHERLREDSSIITLELSLPVYLALERAGIRTVADLAEVTAADLMNLDDFDEDALVELEERLNDFKLRLAAPQETARGKRFPLYREAEQREVERMEQQAATRPPDHGPH